MSPQNRNANSLVLNAWVTLLALLAVPFLMIGCGAKVTASGEKTHVASEDFYATLTQRDVPTWFFADDRQLQFEAPYFADLWTPGSSVVPPYLLIKAVDSSKISTRISSFEFSNIPASGANFQIARGPFTIGPGTTDSTSTCTFTNEGETFWDNLPGFAPNTTKQFQCRVMLNVKGLVVNTDSVTAKGKLIIGNSVSRDDIYFDVVLEYPAGTDKDSAYVKTKGVLAGLHDNLILGKVKVEEIPVTGAGD
jgi:hypothetical protein